MQPSAQQHGLDNLLEVQHQGSDEKGLAAEAEADLEDTQFYHLVELDAQPAGHEGDVTWRRSLEALAACLPRLSEVMGRWGLAGLAVRSMGATVGAARRKGHWGTCESALLSLYSLLFPSLTHQPLLPRRPAVYVSSRVSAAALGQQLRSLPAALPGLTKLELRFILPSSAPCLGAPLAQLQPDLSALTGLQTLYLIQVGAAQRGTLVGLPCDGLGGCVWFC